MVGASKILTVSYGTFSCTLEGFDEPFSTMKAIAEYFRDLAADDRYFGAEPPTPDAQMLHQIAEREIQRRVEAKIQENGVILRAGEEAEAETAPSPAAAAAALAAPAAVAAAEEVAAEEPVAEEPVAETSAEEPVAEAPVAEEPVAEEAQAPAAAEPVVEPEPESPLAADSIAAKLLRIRAAVNQARETTPRSAPAAEPSPVVPETGLQPHLAEVEDVPEDSDYLDTPAPVAAFEAPEEAPVEQAFAAAEDEAEAPTEEVSADETPAEEAAAEPVEAAPVAEEALTEEVQAEEAPEAQAEDQADEAESEAAPVSIALESSVGSFLSTISAPVEVEEEDEDEAAAEDNWNAFADEEGTADEALEAPAEEAVAAEEADTEEDAPAVEEAVAETHAEDLHAEAEEAQPEEAQPEEEVASRPRARVIKVRRVDPSAPPQILRGEEEIRAAMAEDEAALAALSEAPEAAEAPAEGTEEAPAAEAPQDEVTASVAEEADTPTAAETDTGLSAEDEADLQAELAAVERELGIAETHAEAAQEEAPEEDTAAETAEAPAEDGEATPEQVAADRAGRSILETTPSGDNESVNRLMRQTESELKGPESRRRFATIAHLKAAVAATVADRKRRDGGEEEEQTEEAMRSYRDDLARVVRPRRPGGETATPRPATPRPSAPSERPAPLVLVSEQRIDRPEDAKPVSPIRPRRVSSTNGNLAVETFDDAEEDIDQAHRTGQALASSANFAEFAEKIGATHLPDLLEAAAAYSNCVEGLEHFTRPQIMRFAASVREEGADVEGFSREAGLRSFGQLLREGKIQKVKRGQFAISQSSRFIQEAKKVAN